MHPSHPSIIHETYNDRKQKVRKILLAAYGLVEQLAKYNVLGNKLRTLEISLAIQYFSSKSYPQ